MLIILKRGSDVDDSNQLLITHLGSSCISETLLIRIDRWSSTLNLKSKIDWVSTSHRCRCRGEDFRHTEEENYAHYFL